ncbi:exodeoxyribonuclease VII large subunit [Deltaproteobacteria bacterium Smac51]|nr:exodeoxyribonuclease VII large subunit [Deltaproteobacteria bacterium Smac51]
MIPRLLVKTGDSGREIFNPSTLALKIQDSFDNDFGYIWVEGEISELAIPFSGHAYFSLKDREAKLRAVMWKGRRAYAGAALAEGQTVLAKGRLSVYAPRGEFQLVVDYMEPRGEGALRLAYEKLKARLGEEGLFDEARKRPLPYWPERVAVISSPTGAAVRDFIRTARLRRPGAAISLYPVRVQGPEAAREIVAALADLNAWGGFDLIVLTRGGGSLTDLWSFNEEAVVRAVAASRTPTLAAIGHSTDLSLTELAADAQAITPTAAAEAVFRDRAALAAHFDETEARLARAMADRLRWGGERVEQLTRRLAGGLTGLYERRRLHFEHLISRLGRLEDLVGRRGQELDYQVRELCRGMETLLADRSARLDTAIKSLRILSPEPMVDDSRRRVEALTGRLTLAMNNRLEDERRRLEFLKTRLTALSPDSILKRGYALVTRAADGQALTKSADLKVGEDVVIRLAEGRVTSTIKEIS